MSCISVTETVPELLLVCVQGGTPDVANVM